MADPSVGQQLYDDSAKFGRTISTVWKYGLYIFGTILIIMGVYLILKKRDEEDEKNKTPSKMQGGISILAGVMFIFAGYLTGYFAQNYKFFAAGQGVGMVYNIIR